MANCIIFFALGLFVGLFGASVRAIKRGDINAQVGIDDKLAVGLSIDWPEILAIGAVVLIAFVIYRECS